MSQMELLLQILNDANLATPVVTNIIGIIRGGRAAGKTDDEIKAESMQLALDTRAQTDADMTDK